MKAGELVQILTVLRDRLSGILESGARHQLDEAISGVKLAKRRYDEYRKRTDYAGQAAKGWGYTFPPGSPLQFQVCNCKGYNLRADIICNVQWQDEGALPVEQDLVLRVWSTDPHMMYREHLDSPTIGDMVTADMNALQERVMLRYHFDFANPKQPGPRYHLQLGGNPADEEYFWFPKEFDLPRLIHHPLELVLLCQFIVANFFPDKYRTLRADPTWHGAVKLVERSLLREYFSQCAAAIESDQTSLLDRLWNAERD